MPEDEESQEFFTHEKLVQYLIDLTNTLTDARRVLRSVRRDWYDLSDMEINERLGLVDDIVSEDLFQRMLAFARNRHSEDSFREKVDALFEPMRKADRNDDEYYALVLRTYYRVLGLYQEFLEQWQMLLTHIPIGPDTVGEIIDRMAVEAEMRFREDLQKARRIEMEMEAARENENQEVEDSG
jgi:hypothetical protein